MQKKGEGKVQGYIEEDTWEDVFMSALISSISKGKKPRAVNPSHPFLTPATSQRFSIGQVEEKNPSPTLKLIMPPTRSEVDIDFFCRGGGG